MDTGDTAFMLVAKAMVMLMTPGLALFYGGMVRSKNVLSTLHLCRVSSVWVLYPFYRCFTDTLWPLS